MARHRRPTIIGRAGRYTAEGAAAVGAAGALIFGLATAATSPPRIIQGTDVPDSTYSWFGGKTLAEPSPAPTGGLPVTTVGDLINARSVSGPLALAGSSSGGPTASGTASGSGGSTSDAARPAVNAPTSSTGTSSGSTSPSGSTSGSGSNGGSGDSGGSTEPAPSPSPSPQPKKDPVTQVVGTVEETADELKTQVGGVLP